MKVFQWFLCSVSLDIASRDYIHDDDVNETLHKTVVESFHRQRHEKERWEELQGKHNFSLEQAMG